VNETRIAHKLAAVVGEMAEDGIGDHDASSIFRHDFAASFDPAEHASPEGGEITELNRKRPGCREMLR
jgi:hypothetical protein